MAFGQLLVNNMYMNISDFYNQMNPSMKTTTPAVSSLYEKTIPQPLYKIPAIIPEKHHQLFAEQARMVGLTPEEFGQIALREQGPTTKPEDVRLYGWMDPNDRGVMQINKVNEPLIQQRFKREFNRNYNPNLAVDSIIASRIVLEENRRQFEQMKRNQTYTNPYSSQDLIDSYNLGVTGFVQAKKGVPEKVERLQRYQGAEQ